MTCRLLHSLQTSVTWGYTEHSVLRLMCTFIAVMCKWRARHMTLGCRKGYSHFVSVFFNNITFICLIFSFSILSMFQECKGRSQNFLRRVTTISYVISSQCSGSSFIFLTALDGNTQYSPPWLAQTGACRPARGTGTPAPWWTLVHKQPLEDYHKDMTQQCSAVYTGYYTVMRCW